MVEEMKVLHSKLDDISNRTKVIEDKLDKLTKSECDTSSNDTDNLPLGIRLYDARKKYLADDLEKKIWDECDQSFISDEEEGKDCLVRRTITWRNETLTNLCRTLNRRWGDDDQAVKRVPRTNGDVSTRAPTRKDHLFVNLDEGE